MNYKERNAKGIMDSSKMYKGGISGGVIGAGLGLILSISMRLVNIFDPVFVIILCALLGVFTGMAIMKVYNLKLLESKANLKNSNRNEGEIVLREEELNLIRQRVQTGEVKIHKEIISEDKTIGVSVTREELVIEKKENCEKGGDYAKCESETIRIPIREEQIEVVRTPVTIQDVSIYMNEIKDNQHIEETLKSEKLRVKTLGKANVKERE